MTFRTQFQRSQQIANPGSSLKTDYKLRLDKYGKRYLEPVGVSNVHDFIQSHHDSSEVHKLIEKYSMLGDPSILNKKVGRYGDFTGLPSNLAEVYRSVTEANDLFQTLPIEVKREFNHSPSEFFASIGTEKYNKALALLNPKLEKEVTPSNEPQPE